MLVVGWSRATILDGYDGSTTSTFSLPCPPVMKVKVVDFTGDGINDIIVMCADRWAGLRDG